MRSLLRTQTASALLVCAVGVALPAATLILVGRNEVHPTNGLHFYGVGFTAVPRFVEPGSAVAKGSLVAPMPGLVIRVGAQLGDTVRAGLPLIWLEAMKMEHTVVAPGDGVLVELNVEPGQQVEVGAVLARVEDQSEEPAK